MNAVRRLIVEAHRRSLWQVFTVYAAVSWGAYQVLDALPGLIGVPDWVPRVGIVLFLIGLPIVLATAFVQEGGPKRQAVPIDPTLFPGLSLGEESPKTIRSWLTWRRALIAGGLAFVVLGTSAGGYVGLRALGVGAAASLVSSGALEKSDQLVLADFRNATADTLLGGVVTEALRIDLLKSNAFRIADASVIQAALARMQQPTNSPLNGQLARELAQRENLPAVIAGEIGSVGNGYVLSAQVVKADDGTALAAFRETAKTPDALLSAIDRLSRSIRSKIGESLRSVNRSAPLEQVSTSSIEALRKYTAAVRTGGGDAGIQLLDEAIALDSGFAMAYRKKGAYLVNAFRPFSEAMAAYSAAYRLRDRLTPVERALAEADYYQQVVNDPLRAIRSYEQALAIDSLQRSALNNVMIAANATGNYALAERMGKRALSLTATFASSHIGLAIAQFEGGKPDSARATMELLKTRNPRSSYVAYFDAQSAAFRGDYKTADSIAQNLLARESRAARVVGATYTQMVSAVRGRFQDVRANEARFAVDTLDQGSGARLNLVATQALTLGNVSEARRTLDEVVAFQQRRNAPEADRPYEMMSYAAALIGDAPRAREYAARARAAAEANGQIFRGALARAALARVEQADGRTAETITKLQAGLREYECDYCLVFELAQAYDRANQPDSAIANYERYVERPRLFRALHDPIALAPTLLRLGELYDARGNAEKAKLYYARILELWQDADPPFQARLAPVRARLAQLTAER